MVISENLENENITSKFPTADQLDNKYENIQLTEEQEEIRQKVEEVVHWKLTPQLTQRVEQRLKDPQKAKVASMPHRFPTEEEREKEEKKIQLTSEEKDLQKKVSKKSGVIPSPSLTRYMSGRKSA